MAAGIVYVEINHYGNGKPIETHRLWKTLSRKEIHDITLRVILRCPTTLHALLFL